MHGKRRLILCCDGTWDSADSGKAASNVVRLARVISPTSVHGTSQIVYYHPGVGTGNGLDRVIGGGTGVGLARNVRDAYAFLVNNYRESDEIFPFGFSRGAYTARSLGGLIGCIGLLRKQQMGAFLDAWAFARLKPETRERYRPEFERLFPNRIIDVPVRCIGVWDTVGALGIPPNRLTGDLQLCRTAYKFLNVTLGTHVQFAFQALAIDEQRAAFRPAIWDRDPDAPTDQVLRQVWFRGVHSDIGGGYQAHGAADLSFLWMASQLHELLDLDRAAIANELDRSEVWCRGTLHDSRTIYYKVLEKKFQRPVCRRNDTEFAHESVFERDDVAPNLRDAPRKPFSQFELAFEWEQQRSVPVSPPFSARRDSLCDRVVRGLGGG